MIEKIKNFLKNKQVDNLPQGVHSQWITLNRVLMFYRYMSAVFIFLALGAWVMMAWSLLRDPFVVVLNHKERIWVESEKKDVPIEREEVVEIIKRFIEKRYQWKKLNLDEVLHHIQPITTSGLLDKIKDDLLLFIKNDLSKKKFEQAVANIDVKISDSAVIASFDRVIRVDGLPLVAPLQLSLELIRGSRTRFNPIGLYINGIIEHQRN
ncbi:MAG: hypothetical protein H6623_01695 [Bdellovibrionaceae bacterium]|nr:hypothetical protein [Pseudobdellovibrionaceae bacterium]